MQEFKNLLLFSNRIAPELALEFIDLVQAYANAEHKATVQLLKEIQDTKRPYSVVAIAGTAEQLLTDVTNTNVGDIKVGDKVKYNPNIPIELCDIGSISADMMPTHQLEVLGMHNFEGVIHLIFVGKEYMYPAKYFRKVSTPSTNPLNSVEGC